MAEYELTTLDVVEGYARSQRGDGSIIDADEVEMESRFDALRWLAAHDREVAAKAWDRGHGTDCDGIEHSLDGCERVNPYVERGE